MTRSVCLVYSLGLFLAVIAMETLPLRMATSPPHPLPRVKLMDCETWYLGTAAQRCKLSAGEAEGGGLLPLEASLRSRERAHPPKPTATVANDKERDVSLGGQGSKGHEVPGK